MIKTFIFVEDGSVDLDELKSSVGDDVLVISYRQGATPPAIQQPREPVSRREVNIKDRLLDLMIEFDEMGFAPTTVCPNGEQYAIDWREKVRKEFARLTAKNAALQKRLDNAVELPCKVGDTVWEVFNNALIFERKVYHINLREKETTFCLSGKSGIIHLGIVELIDYNKTWFTDRAAAEARLAELKGGKV